MTSNDIRKIIKSNTFSVIKIPDLPRHTQSVEGYIELVLKASFLVNGHASTEGLIKKKLASKVTMTCFDTKSQYSIENFTII